ncbi:tetratricopeptide repeat protein [Pontibacter roseus]|uniref:hypothetical protein n=1 Tax=Pontibacter roseus TaxID=336989 RepID=UPI00037FA920|nr:hypothetical protein [Pontibacter roseus]
MKTLFTIIFLISLLGGGLQTISRINEYSSLASQAYSRHEYIEAIAAYEYLLTDLEVQDDKLRLNLGHAYFRAGELQQARQQYYMLASHSSKEIRAVALLQLGNISAKGKQFKQALAYFRSALIAEPSNQAARYNYELLKKFLAQRPELADSEEEETAPPTGEQSQEQQRPDSLGQTPPPSEEEHAPEPKNKPDSTGDQEEEIEKQEQADDGQQEQKGSGKGQDQPDKGNSERAGEQEKEEASGQEKGETKGLNPNNAFDQSRPERSRTNDQSAGNDPRAQTRNSRLRQMNISPDKARLMLDAMRHAEQQYIQQLPKKPTRKPDSSKPDW